MSDQVHLCFSGNLACSGCRPCPQCFHVIRMQVIPAGMIAAGVANTPQQAQAFLDGYTNGAAAFFDAIAQDPQWRTYLAVTDVGDLVRLQQEQMARAMAQAMPAPVPSPMAASVGAPPFAMPFTPHGAPEATAPTGARPAAPVPIEVTYEPATVPGVPAPAAPGPPAAPTLDANDIAAAIDVPTPSNGTGARAAIGNVMQVPPDLQSHLNLPPLKG